MVAYLQRETHWTCPNCTFTDVTFDPRPHSRMHACKGMKGITAPMVPDGVRCKVEAVEREDYVGKDIAQYDGDGKAIMSVVTTRDDGQDTAVLAATATGGFRE